ncbi:MAG: cupin domain-containing protein [Synergistaceae bacterium]|nr:cupin domain-containing protein [Synergistaceae bacterium]
MLKGNLFSPVSPAPEEFTEILASGNSDTFRIERIVSQGHVSPPGFWYDQDESEFAAVLQGSAELEFSDGKISMSSGDWVIIPEHERHRVTYTSINPPCVWLAVFWK